MPKLILMDADGVLWRGRSVIRQAPGFVKRAKAAGLRVVIVSNNAGPNREAYTDKCMRLGLDFDPQDIFSVNHLAGHFVARHYPGKQTFVVGSEMLVTEMRKHVAVTGAEEWLAEHGAAGRPAAPDDLKILGDARFDLVFIGIDVNVNYLKLAMSCILIQKGAVLVGANPDYSFPFENGAILPGNGSVVELVAGVTKVKPVYLGKPSPYLLEQVELETGIDRTDMVMIGDRPETDYDFARNAGIHTYMVQTGVTPPKELPPDGEDVTVVPTLDEVAGKLGI